MTWDEVIERVYPYVGERVRVTFPNGARKVGLIGMWREHLTLGGYLMGGEYAGAVLVEVMQENGRYAIA